MCWLKMYTRRRREGQLSNKPYVFVCSIICTDKPVDTGVSLTRGILALERPSDNHFVSWCQWFDTMSRRRLERVKNMTLGLSCDAEAKTTFTRPRRVKSFSSTGAMRAHSYHGASQSNPYPRTTQRRSRTAQRTQSANVDESPAKSRCAGIVRLPRARKKISSLFRLSRPLELCVFSMGILGLVSAFAANYSGGVDVSKPGILIIIFISHSTFKL
jgi:hypothetical protein